MDCMLTGYRPRIADIERIKELHPLLCDLYINETVLEYSNCARHSRIAVKTEVQRKLN